MLKIYVIPVLLFISSSIYPQINNSRNSNNDFKKYLKDGRIGRAKNLVCIRASRTLGAYFGLSVERKVSRRFGLEVGLYKKFGSGAHFESFRYLGTAENREGDVNSVQEGHSILLYPKYYFTGRGGLHLNHGLFLGIRTNIQKYTATMNYKIIQPGIKAQSIVAGLMFGSHQQFGSCFTWGLEWGFGFYIDKFKDVTDTWTYNQWTRKTTTTQTDLEVSGAIPFIDFNVGILF